jgi:hypothetical protein
MGALESLPELQCKTLVQAIKQCNLSRLIAHLGDKYQSYSSVFVRIFSPSRRRIIWLLGCLENSDAMPTLIQAIDDQDKIVVYEAVKARNQERGLTEGAGLTPAPSVNPY